jgi:hypothetical protein
MSVFFNSLIYIYYANYLMVENTCSHFWYELRVEEDLADVVIIASVGTGPQLQFLNSLIGRREPSTHKSSKSSSLVLPKFLINKNYLTYLIEKKKFTLFK